MALKDVFNIEIQQRDVTGQWAECVLTESSLSTKETANAGRTTSMVEVEAKLFRFLVKLDKSYQWGATECIRLLVTCDEGWILNEYQVLVNKPGL